jgi:hypothetical protein
MYRIGQVLYVIVGKSKTVDPCKVVRKQTDETVDGVTIQHVCENAEGETFSLESWQQKNMLAGVFERIDDARSHLLQLATEMVDRLVEKAAAKAQEQFGVQEFPQPTTSILSGSFSSTTDTIILDDGTRARVHLPPELQHDM